MLSKNEQEQKKVKRAQAWYNIIPNLFWSILNLTPISIYCFNVLDRRLFYLFLALSLIPLFLRNSLLDKLQIGRTIGIYKQLRVPLINKLAQNGVIINDLLKSRFPDYRVVTSKKSSIAGLIAQTYIFEKFHLIFFLFYSFTMIYAIANEHWVWACVILLTNVAYNVYPNLLQQYIRVKLRLFRNRY